MNADSTWLSSAAVIFIIAIIPLFLIAATSFAKIAIVLGIIGNAMGVRGIFSAPIVAALSLVTTLFIMGPVMDQTLEALKTSPQQNDAPEPHKTLEILRHTSSPLAAFLQKNTPQKEIDFFQKLRPSEKTSDFRLLLVAFASSQLLQALKMGFLILMPFLLVDLLVATTLGAMGIANLSVTFVSLPLKLLLLIASDGWHMILTALIKSYAG